MKIFFILIVFTFISCQKQQPDTAESNRKIDPILDNIFKVKFPNYENNELVRDNAKLYLGNKIDSILPLNLLDDIPVEVFRIIKNPHGKGILVQFKTSNDLKTDNLSDRVTFDILGFTDEKKASDLVENDQKYLVFGKYKSRLTKAETSILVSRVYHSYDVEISKSNLDNKFEFNFGNLLVEIDSIRPIY